MNFSNEGGVDRTVRVLTGTGLVVVGAVLASGSVGFVLMAVGVIALVTGVVGWCPGYAVCGISTRKITH